MYEDMHMKKSCTNIDAGVVCILHVNNVVSGGLKVNLASFKLLQCELTKKYWI